MNGKKKQIRRSFALIMAVIMVLSTCFTDLRLFGGWTESAAPKKAEAKTVKGAKITNPDHILTTDDVDSGLLNYIHTTVGQDATVYKVSQYSGSVTVPAGAGLHGIYYFENAASFDITNVSDTTIPDSTFMDCKGATTVTMSDKVTEIGDNAFSGCEKLETIDLTKVMSVGEAAFNGCTALSQETYEKLVSKTLTKLGKSAFAGCKALTSLKVPKVSDFDNLGTTVYNGCSGATEIDFLDASIPRIPAEMFQNCGDITSSKFVTVKTAGVEGFPKQIDNIGNAAFAGCALKKVDLSGCTKLTSIGDRSFHSAAAITDITFPDALTTIGQAAFQKACLLADITIPKNVISLGDGVFQASGIRSVTFNCNNLEEIPSLAFNNSESMESVTFTDGANSNLKVISADGFSNTSLQDLDFLPTLTKLEEIGDYAFSMCYSIDNVVTTDEFGVLNGNLTGITDITIPDCVTTLGKGAFSDNHSLKTVKIGNGITQIPRECFAAVTDKQTDDWKDKVPVSLEKVILPSGLTSIGTSAFEGNYSLMTMSYQTGTETKNVITFPETLEKVNAAAFKNCAFFQKSDSSTEKYKYTGMTTVKFPDNVTTLGEGVFEGCSHLDSVVLPKNLEIIPDSLFSKCSIDKSDMPETMAQNGYVGLKSVTLPAKLTTIGSRAFETCLAFDFQNDGLLPSTLKEIKDYAFYECKSMTKVVFPNALETIGEYAFANCSETESVTYSVLTNSGDIQSASVNVVKSGLNTVNMAYAENLTSIGSYAFSSAAIAGFSLGAANKLEKLGSSAFEGCTKLTQVNLFDKDGNSSLKSIGSDCFKDCMSLNMVTLPYSTKMSSSAFSGMAATGPDGDKSPENYLTITANKSTSDKEVQVPLNGQKALPVAFFVESMLSGKMTIEDENKTDLTAEGGNDIVSATYETPSIIMNGLKEGSCKVQVFAPLKFSHAGKSFTKNFTYNGTVEVKPVPCTELNLTGKRVITNSAGEKTMYIPFGSTTEYTVRANFGPSDTSDKPETKLSTTGTLTFKDNGIKEPLEEGAPYHYEYKFLAGQYGETTFTCKMGEMLETLIIKTCCPGKIQANTTEVKITSGFENYDLSSQVSLVYDDEYADLCKQYPDKLQYVLDEPSPYMTIDESSGFITTTQKVTETEYEYVTVRSIASYAEVTITIQLCPELTDFEISEQTVGLKIGETKEIYIKDDETLKPSTAGRRMTWTTSNSKVVSLSSTKGVADKGTGITGSRVVLKGVANGTATITAKSVNGLVKTVPVKVSKEGIAPPAPTKDPNTGGSGGSGGGSGGSGGSGGGTGGRRTINVSRITLKTTYPSKVIYLKKGKGYKINSIVAPAKNTNKLVWTSSNTSKVKVSGGFVRGVAPGKATVTLTAYNGSSVVRRASIKVVVLKKAVKAKSVKIKGKKKLKVGRSIQLKAVVKPKKCTATIKWTSKTKKIASVDKYGVVTGKKKGTAKIVAKATPGKKSKVFKIKVTK